LSESPIRPKMCLTPICSSAATRIPATVSAIDASYPLSTRLSSMRWGTEPFVRLERFPIQLNRKAL
jgi:hypothetical protein